MEWRNPRESGTKQGCLCEVGGEQEKEEKQTNKKRYKVTKSVGKLVVTTVKTSIFKHLDVELGNKDEDRKMYRLSKAQVRKV